LATLHQEARGIDVIRNAIAIALVFAGFTVHTKINPQTSTENSMQKTRWNVLKLNLPRSLTYKTLP